MIRAMQVAPPLYPTVRRRAAAAHGLGRLAPLTRSWVGLAVIGLVMGTLVLSLPSAWNPAPSAHVFHTVTHETMRPPQGPAFGGDASPSPSPPAAHRAVLRESPGWLPQGCLTRDDCDLEDDHLASMVVTTPGRLCLLPPLTATGISPVPQTFPWPCRWLVRPQHLTYAEALPTGRPADAPCPDAPWCLDGMADGSSEARSYRACTGVKPRPRARPVMAVGWS